MAKRPLRLGVIGAGSVAQVSHLPVLKKRRDLEVVAICDDDGERARLVAQHFGIPRVTSDYESLLRGDEVDAVIIATPNHLHAPITLAALGYGKHVLCEKPPARNAAEAEQMAEAAKRAGQLSEDRGVALLESMTDEVSALVLEDSRPHRSAS